MIRENIQTYPLVQQPTQNSTTPMLYSRSTTRIGISGVAIAALLSVSNIHAATLAYEGFDYPVGNLDTTANGGFGWSQAWQPTTASGSLANQQVFATGFTYTDALNNSLVVTGGRAHVTGDGSATGDNIGGVGTTTSITPTRGFNFSRGVSGVAESTWISFIALRTGFPLGSPGQPAQTGDHVWGRASSAQIYYNSASSTTGGSEMFAIGRGTQSAETTAATSALPNDTWAMLQQGSSSAVKASTVNWASSPADFILMRIDHVGGIASSGSGTALNLVDPDTVRIWINPLLDTLPSDASADITFNANDFNAANGVATLGLNRDFVMNRFRIFAGGTNGVTGYGSIEMDEIRVGEQFADVTPYTAVPEPAFGAMVGLGVLAVLLKRRR